MRMILKIAWRSIGRNRKRTAISIASITLGLACVIFFVSLGDGVYYQLIQDAVRMQAGHVTVERAAYRSAPAVDLWIDGAGELAARLARLPDVRQVKLLIQGQAVAKSGYAAVGVSVAGVQPRVEENLSPLASHMVAGSYLAKSDACEAVMGRALADRLKIAVGRKFVVSANDAHGVFVEEVCRVKGLFETGSDEIDGYVLQLPITFTRRLYGLPEDAATQVGVLAESGASVQKLRRRVSDSLPPGDLVAHPWPVVLPELAGYIRVDKGSNVIFQALLILIILFTIFNTVFMSVIEREKEFAILLAVGTPIRFLKSQVLAESGFIAGLGCAFGILLGGALALYFQWVGLDLTRFYREGITVSGFAVSSVLHARLTTALLAWSSGLVFASTVILSLFPLRRIDRLSIVEHVR